MTVLGVDFFRPTPEWAVPLWEVPATYRGAKGGRSSGKSHEIAGELVERILSNPNYSTVCVREIQKSLKYSAKRLIETKIREFGVSHLFKVTNSEIKHKYGQGIFIFEGMQAHNSDSIKSLEGFDCCWVEEAHSLSQVSLDLLIPTIRKPGSEIIFTWNPDQPEDAVDKFFASNPDNAVCIHVNYLDNPWCPLNVIDLANDWKRRRPDTYDHVWLGGYNTKADDQVLNGCWREDEFEVQEHWDGPYWGADWGFSVDPSTLMGVYIDTTTKPAATLYVRFERYGHGIEINDYPEFFDGEPKCKGEVIRGDNSRPEIISYIQKHGYPLMMAADKWPGSVEDGISTLRGFNEIVIHPDCENTLTEARLWKYKRDRLTDDITTKLIDGNDHCWDAIRYALDQIIQNGNNLVALLNLSMGKK